MSLDDDAADVDKHLECIRDTVNDAAKFAIAASDKAQESIRKLEEMGFKIRLAVGVNVGRDGVLDKAALDAMAAQSAADAVDAHDRAAKAAKLQEQIRFCPHCSTTAEKPFRMRSTFVRERVAEPGSHGTIEGAQVRFSCSLCGYGEVEPL